MCMPANLEKTYLILALLCTSNTKARKYPCAVISINMCGRICTRWPVVLRRCAGWSVGECLNSLIVHSQDLQLSRNHTLPKNTNGGLYLGINKNQERQHG